MVVRIADSLCELIGDTPLVRLGRSGTDLPGEIVGKLEQFQEKHAPDGDPSAYAHLLLQAVR